MKFSSFSSSLLFSINKDANLHICALNEVTNRPPEYHILSVNNSAFLNNEEGKNDENFGDI